MKKLLFLLLFVCSFVFANEPHQEWEALDLEEQNLQEMQQEQRREFEEQEGDLQIQAEEEEIIPLESEDSRMFEEKKNPKRD